jgi:hypothetical protein
MCDGIATSRWVPVSATGVWAAGWLAAAYAAVHRAVRSPDGSAWLAVGVAVLMAALYSWVLVGLSRASNSLGRTGPAASTECCPSREPWGRRILGYLAAILWSGVAVVWNVGFIGWLVEAAGEGRGWWVLVLIPWSLAGWFLLVVLFAGIAVMIDSLRTVLRRLIP